MSNLILDHFQYQQPFDGRFEAEHDSDWFCKERVLVGWGGKAPVSVSCAVQQELLTRLQVWPETKHRLAQVETFKNFVSFSVENFEVDFFFPCSALTA